MGRLSGPPEIRIQQELIASHLCYPRAQPKVFTMSERSFKMYRVGYQGFEPWASILSEWHSDRAELIPNLQITNHEL